jgi:hypothetical protein
MATVIIPSCGCCSTPCCNNWGQFSQQYRLTISGLADSNPAETPAGQPQILWSQFNGTWDLGYPGRFCTWEKVVAVGNKTIFLGFDNAPDCTVTLTDFEIVGATGVTYFLSLNRPILNGGNVTNGTIATSGQLITLSGGKINDGHAPGWPYPDDTTGVRLSFVPVGPLINVFC